MTHEQIVFYSILIRGACSALAIAGAVFLAYKGQDGWGWLIFLAIVLGSYSLTSNNN